MDRTNHRAGGIVLAIVLATMGSADVQAAASEERLRDQLRQTTVQLRDAQDSLADVKAQLERANAQLNAQRSAVEAAAPLKSTARETAALRRAVDERDRRITVAQQQLEESQKLLGQWQEAYRQAAALAKARDADAKRFEGQYAESNARVQVCTKDNGELVAISNEVLDRYRKKGVWASLKNDEPVTQLHRIRLEALAQDYHAEIVDRTVSPPADTATPPAGLPK